MNLAISNIAWSSENDQQVYELMIKYNFTGLEIAPTRIFPDSPYKELCRAREWATSLFDEKKICVPSMQSIWYGREEKLFGDRAEREILFSYTRQAIDFAVSIGCNNLVFGCPKNRTMPRRGEEDIAIEFFYEIGQYAFEQGTVIGIEANPVIYNTNFINTTLEAVQLIKRINSKGIKLNFDLGAMLYNKETINMLDEQIDVINHVHISEPGLELIKKRRIHQEISQWLKNNQYERFISVEMCRQDDISVLENVMYYIKEIFG